MPEYRQYETPGAESGVALGGEPLRLARLGEVK
jgi:hypothetical protein